MKRKDRRDKARIYEEILDLTKVTYERTFYSNVKCSLKDSIAYRVAKKIHEKLGNDTSPLFYRCKV